MATFKNGDRVRITGYDVKFTAPFMEKYDGCTGTVTRYNGLWYNVDLDDGRDFLAVPNELEKLDDFKNSYITTETKTVRKIEPCVIYDPNKEPINLVGGIPYLSIEGAFDSGNKVELKIGGKKDTCKFNAEGLRKYAEIFNNLAEVLEENNE